ncbi:heterochromatin protein 1-binding protein 3-like [Mya arenaria]|uniref:heterochromatin protein 1-binding protein 3-like n=1 Tax=Mya arenaria TaxID=6604 RepID=UPI0022E89C89|nr:heterochromatin protein 1-binding protein 3-like [Mya arenaria]
MPAIKLKKVTAEYLAEKEKKEAELQSKEKAKKSLEDVASEESGEASGDGDETEKKGKNFLDVEILFDKRKRTLPKAEQNLIEWLDTNLEKKEGVYLPLMTLYTYYSELGQMTGNSVVDTPVFQRYLREKFGKFFGFQDSSPYKVLIKERKEKKKKVEGETAQIKIREVIKQALEDLGNFRNGHSFKNISRAIMQKFPAQRVDIYPKRLKSALERGLSYGHLELMRGVGMCGYYRLPGEPTKEEPEKKPKKKPEEEKKDGEDKKDAENGEGESSSGGEEKKDEGEDGEAKEGDKDEEKDEGEKATGEQEEKPKKKRKKPKKKPVEAWVRSELERHSNPQKVEDVIPLAITYQSDPKQASMTKIKAYIRKFYHTEVAPEKLKRVLDEGVASETWENVGGSTYHLLVDTFTPSRSGKLADQIAQAIVACSEPKIASAVIIKKYISEYHPKFDIDNKVHLFKHAIERACSKGKIRQLSGIGSTGSFQLVDQFYPSPAILAGYTSDSEDESAADDEAEEVQEYVPRPTKKGRLAIKDKYVPAPVSKRPAPGARGRSRESKSKAKKYVDVDSSDEEMATYTPQPSRSRGKSPGSAKAKPAPASKTAAKSTPKKSKAKPSPPKKALPSTDRKTRDRVNYRDEDSDLENLDDYTPRPSKSRGDDKTAAKPAPAKPKGRQAAKRLQIEISEDEFSEEEQEVAPSPPKKAKTEAKTPTPKKGQKKAAGSAKKGKRKR